MQYGGQAQQPYGGYRPVRRRTSGLAMASLILGLLGLVSGGLLAPIGVVLAIIALIQISRRPHELEGQGLAIGGLVVSCLMSLLIPIMAAILLPVLITAREKARMFTCAENMNALLRAADVYRQEWDGRWPLKDNWCDALMPHVNNRKTAFWCAASESTYGIEYNAALSGVRHADLANKQGTPVFFDGLPRWNSAGSISDLQFRHDGSANVAFADGRVVYFGADEATRRFNMPFEGQRPQPPPGG